MYLDDALLYNQGYMISINDLDSPLFYLFDYDSRSFKINMSFQHFHQFHEIHILLSGRASHIIEGDYYTLQPYDIVLLRPSMLHKTEYPSGGDCRRLIINAGIRRLVIRDSPTEYRVVDVQKEWVEEDDSLPAEL